MEGRVKGPPKPAVNGFLDFLRQAKIGRKSSRDKRTGR